MAAHALVPSESAVDQGRNRPILPAGGAAPQACRDGAGQGGGVPSLALSSHFETGRSRLVADLSGEWSRFGLWWLGLTRFRRRGPEARGPVAEVLRNDSPLFSRLFPLAVPDRAFADLENRQRRKSFVGSNPTPSAWFSGGLTTLSVFTPRPGSPRRVRLPTRPRPRLLPHTRLFAWVRPNPEPSYRLVQETQAGHGPRRSSKQRCFAKAAAALRHKKLQVLALQLQRSFPFDS